MYMKFFEHPNLPILQRLSSYTVHDALSKPTKSLSLTYTILSLIKSLSFKNLTFSLGITIKVFLTQGIFLSIDLSA